MLLEDSGIASALVLVSIPAMVAGIRMVRLVRTMAAPIRMLDGKS